MEILDSYIDLCKIIGPNTEWIQGMGGNISVKGGNDLIIKQSGTRIADANRTEGWIHCDLSKVKKCLESEEEDLVSTVIKGNGKPSIETFLHSFPPRFIIHLHPTSALLSSLCSKEFYADSSSAVMIDYYKPGVPLAKELEKVYKDSISVYFFKNHGIMITAETIESIVHQLKVFEKIYNVEKVYKLYYDIKLSFNKSLIIKQCDVKVEGKFVPYTPDIAVFLQSGPLYYKDDSSLKDYYRVYGVIPTVAIIDEKTYVIASSLSRCYDLVEILNAYSSIKGDNLLCLSDKEVFTLTHWDKELLRKQSTQ